MNFTEEYGVNWAKGSNSSIYSHLNLDALSLWYQISAKPDFYKIFEAMLKVRNQFVDEFFLRVVAYNAYHYMFKIKITVMESVLGFLDPASAEAMYQDQFLGMNSPSKLLHWFQALTGGKGSYMYNLIQTYYDLQGIPLNDTFMTNLLGPKNMLAQTYNAQRSLAYKLF